MDDADDLADEFQVLEKAIMAQLAKGPASVEDLTGALHQELKPPLDALPIDQLGSIVEEFALFSEHVWLDSRTDLVHSTIALMQPRVFVERVQEHGGRPALQAGPALDLVVDPTRVSVTPDGDGLIEVEISFDALGGSIWVYLPETLAAQTAPGDLVAVTADGNQLDMQVVAESTLHDGQAEVDVITAAVQEVGAGNGLETWPAMLDLFIDHPSLFTQPLAPLSELLEAAGIEDRDGYMGLAGTEWHTYGEQAFHARSDSVTEYFALRECCTNALDRLGAQWRSWDRAHTEYAVEFGHQPDSPAQTLAWAETEVDVHAVIEAVAHDMVLPAFMVLHRFGVVDRREPNAANGFDGADFEDSESLLRSYRLHGLGWQTPSASFELFVALVAERAERSHPGVDMLQAQLHSMNGDSLEAERFLRTALRMDDGQPAVLLALMGSAIDASRFDEAMRFSDRAFGPENESSRHLAPFAQAIVTASRNEPCPCGSGRKYKQCHANSVLLDPSALSRALMFKLGRFADEWFRHAIMWDAGPDQEIAEMAVDDPTIRDFMTFESPMIERFIELRAELLPDDELDQLSDWQESTRRLFEITQVVPGETLTLRDMTTDELMTVVERTGSHEAQVGDMVLARCEERHGVATTFGAVVRVESGQEDDMLDMLGDDPDCYDFVEWYESTMVGPTITNRDGELFEPHVARFSTTASVHQVVELLDERFGEADMGLDIDELRWTEVHIAGPDDAPAPGEDDAVTAIDETDEDLVEENWIRAEVAIEGDLVTLATTSQERHQRFVAELLELLPGSKVVEEQRTSQQELFEMVMAEHDRGPG